MSIWGLVCLATCESARSDDPQGFLGIAPQLVQRGLPTVVAMQDGGLREDHSGLSRGFLCVRRA